MAKSSADLNLHQSLEVNEVMPLSTLLRIQESDLLTYLIR